MGNPRGVRRDFEALERRRLEAARLPRQGLRRGEARRVAKLIEQECGVQYHPGHVWRILRDLGWSVQRPIGRAVERDEQAIRRWKETRWPALKKKPRGKAAP